MRRAILVGVCLTAVASLGLVAQQKPATTACQEFAKTDTLFKFGTEWLSWSENERSVYLRGLIDGNIVLLKYTFTKPEPERQQILDYFKATALQYKPDALVPVMTSLYRDPANVFIRYNSMIFIARDKLSGADVEGQLRQARQSDCGS